ncbi:hypothetical protein [Mycobacteroides abscessus]|nr:hypothetical protein [Mycobacteroides abscessus]EPZ18412.1 hypothetical protein M879_21600 [Mycobacteroides abscessus V06705]MDM2692239.1 hypothetical protein [Mycobacteroides abscessus]MDM2697051.1 hypothetical protein [Mycobacteroides abscessus]MDO3265650.1 hypothetical protein [Mycobacteroides abscessus subsp. abscessus]SHV42499.1 Uncharacterised protein [Mycobacteroides abscessus subsp. abscessus]
MLQTCDTGPVGSSAMALRLIYQTLRAVVAASVATRQAAEE